MVMEPSAAGTLTMLLLGALLLFVARRTTGSIVSPPSLYALLWCATLALYYAGVVIYYPIRLTTALLFVGSTIAFVVGGAVAGYGRDLNWPVHGWSDQKQAGHVQKMTLVIALIAVGGGIGYYLRLHQLIGINSLWENPVLVRLEEIGRLQRLGWLGIARSLLIPAFVLLILIRRNFEIGRSRKVLLAAAVCFFFLIPNGGRTLLLTLATWTTLAILYSAEAEGERQLVRRYARPLAVLAALGFVYFMAIGLVLNKALGESYAIDQVTRLPRALNGIADVLHYQIAAIPSFQFLLDAPEEFQQRASLTFGVVSRVLVSLDPERFSLPQYVQPFVNVPLPANLYTWLDVFYMDFGWYGVMILPFLFGLVTTRVYHWMRAKPSTLRIYTAAFLGVCILQTTAVNRFGQLQTWAWLLIPPAILALVHFVMPVVEESAV